MFERHGLQGCRRVALGFEVGSHAFRQEHEGLVDQPVGGDLVA